MDSKAPRIEESKDMAIERQWERGVERKYGGGKRRPECLQKLPTSREEESKKFLRNNRGHRIRGPQRDSQDREVGEGRDRNGGGRRPGTEGANKQS